jgi:hypothetical protein
MNARHSLRFFAPLAAALLTACGGGDESGASVSQLPPSVTYPTPSGYVVGASTTPLTPVVSGRVSAFTVAPPLPAGMEISPSSGAIFGTPTAVSPTTTYTVEARSGNDRVVAKVTLTVRDVVPEISYANTSLDLEQNEPVACIAPTIRGGAVVTWEIDRPLPAGLQFDLGNGQICGTPTVLSARTDYRVTATNTGGSSSATLAIAVLAMSSSGRPAFFASGARQTQIEVSGPIRWKLLAVDGSYLVAATDAELIVWASTGEVLFSKPGRYADALVFAAPRELRIGGADARAIESIAVPTGISTFVAITGDTAWIHPRAP